MASTTCKKSKNLSSVIFIFIQGRHGLPPLSRYVRQCLRQIFISSPEGPSQNQLFKRANFRHGILSGDSHEGRAVRLFSRKILARGVLCRHPMQEGIPRFPVCTGKFVAGLFPPPGRAALALFNGRGRGIECQPKRPPAYAGKFAVSNYERVCLISPFSSLYGISGRIFSPSTLTDLMLII